MALILATGSPKGGVGKSTQSVTLATIAARDYGLDVLLVDADSNHTALDWADRGSAEIFPFDVADAVDQTDRLADLRNTHHDLVVVDLPGAREGAFRAMLAGPDGRPVPDLLLVPCSDQTIDLRPVIRVLEHEVIPTGLDYVLVMAPIPTSSIPDAIARRDELRSRHTPIVVADQIIRRYAAYRDAFEADRTVLDLPGAHSYARIAEAEQRALAAELFPRLGITRRPRRRRS
ncbi:MAG: hypothetical protein ACRDTJ_10495 [Pseudonocardiaceae bacterium]